MMNCKKKVLYQTDQVDIYKKLSINCRLKKKINVRYYRITNLVSKMSLWVKKGLNKKMILDIKQNPTWMRDQKNIVKKI